MPPAAPEVREPTHDSLLVSWLENELASHDAPITKYLVCWQEVDNQGNCVGGT